MKASRVETISHGTCRPQLVNARRPSICSLCPKQRKPNLRQRASIYGQAPRWACAAQLSHVCHALSTQSNPAHPLRPQPQTFLSNLSPRFHQICEDCHTRKFSAVPSGGGGVGRPRTGKAFQPWENWPVEELASDHLKCISPSNLQTPKARDSMHYELTPGDIGYS